jgi:hypothetical protein
MDHRSDRQNDRCTLIDRNFSTFPYRQSHVALLTLIQSLPEIDPLSDLQSCRLVVTRNESPKLRSISKKYSLLSLL